MAKRLRTESYLFLNVVSVFFFDFGQTGGFRYLPNPTFSKKGTSEFRPNIFQS